MNFETLFYEKDESLPGSQPQKFLARLVDIFKNQLENIFEDKSIGLYDEHPRIVLSMMITNILVNSAFGMIITNDIPTRLRLFEDQDFKK